MARRYKSRRFVGFTEGQFLAAGEGRRGVQRELTEMRVALPIELVPPLLEVRGHSN